MIIDQLPAIELPVENTDEIPIERGQLTFKVAVSELPGGGGGASPATDTPLMDGTAAVGVSDKYAREDHVHPTDTTRQATLVSGTNIKTVNNNSLLGSGNITISGGGAVSSVNGKTGTVVLDLDDIGFATLVWTNASPSSNFAAQTIPLDLSEYGLVLIETAANSTSSTVLYRDYVFCVIGQSCLSQFVLNVTGTSGSAVTIVTREIKAQNTGIVCTDGYYKQARAADNTQPTTENNRCVPLRIWGIKGVE